MPQYVVEVAVETGIGKVWESAVVHDGEDTGSVEGRKAVGEKTTDVTVCNSKGWVVGCIPWKASDHGVEKRAGRVKC